MLPLTTKYCKLFLTQIEARTKTVERHVVGLRQDCLALAAIFVTTDSVAVLQVLAHFTNLSRVCNACCRQVAAQPGFCSQAKRDSRLFSARLLR